MTTEQAAELVSAVQTLHLVVAVSGFAIVISLVGIMWKRP
jgi:hypothetical protein